MFVKSRSDVLVFTGDLRWIGNVAVWSGLSGIFHSKSIRGIRTSRAPINAVRVQLNTAGWRLG